MRRDTTRQSRPTTRQRLPTARPPTRFVRSRATGSGTLNYTTISSWALLIWRALEEAGHDPAPVFEHADLDPALLEKPGARYPLNGMQACWQRAVEVSSDACFGLAVARHWHPTTWHAVGIAWLASRTLADAFTRLVRHSAMLSTASLATLERIEDRYLFSVSLKMTNREPVPASADAVCAVLVSLARTSLGDGFAPLSVSMRHAPAGCHDELEAYFRCPLHYGTDAYVIEMRAADLDRELPTVNNELLASTEQVIADYLAQLHSENVVARARAEILKQLPSGAISEESVAAALHMSLRTFQRRLRDEKTVYRELIESVRRDLAETYITNPRLSITEISYLLGFSEPSSFARTFKRWTGNSPSEQRRTAA
jgi:AraC-like DNA-binding protein